MVNNYCKSYDMHEQGRPEEKAKKQNKLINRETKNPR